MKSITSRIGLGKVAAFSAALAFAVACSSQSEGPKPAASNTINTNELLARPITLHSRFGTMTFQKNGGLVIGPASGGTSGTTGTPIVGTTPSPVTGTTPTLTTGTNNGLVVVPGATAGTFNVTPAGGSGTMEINGQRYVMIDEATQCSGEDDMYTITAVGIDAAGFTAAQSGGTTTVSNLKLAVVGGFVGSEPAEGAVTNYNVVNVGQFANEFATGIGVPSSPFGRTSDNGGFNFPGFNQNSAFIYAATFNIDGDVENAENVEFAFHFPTTGRVAVNRTGAKTRVALNYGAVRTLRVRVQGQGSNATSTVTQSGGGIFTFNVECGGEELP